MNQIFRDEVLALHRFLDNWLKGDTSKGDGHPKPLDKALSEDFVIVHPDGSRSNKSEVMRAFSTAYDVKQRGYKLEVGQVETRMIGEEICLATYEEWHRGEPGRARISTAVLKHRPESGHIEWLFLQETLAPHLETEDD